MNLPPDFDKPETRQPGPAPVPANVLRIEPGGQSLPGYGGAYGYEGAVLGATEFSFVHYLQVLYRRRYVCASVFLAIVSCVALYTFTRTPLYQASVRILIEKENPNVVSFKEVMEQDRENDDYYETQYRILQSRGLARRAIDDLDLWQHPQFNAPQQGIVGRVIGMPTALARRVFRGAKPVETPDEAETKAQSKVVDAFLRDLNVAPVRYSRLVDVKFDSPDPALAARVANAVSNEYILQSMELKYAATRTASDWLGDQMLTQRKQLDASEQALQRYREQTDSVSFEDRQNIVVQKLTDLNAAVTRAKTERIQKETAYNQIRAVQADQKAMDTVPVILSNLFVQQQKTELADLQRQQAQLSEKLGPNHPDMIKLDRAMKTADARIQGEIGKIVLAMRSDYEAALTQERTLAGALEQQKQEAIALNRMSIEYNSLQRDAATNRTLFEGLMQRTKETDISGDLKTSHIRIVDQAETPRRPYSPNTTANLLLGLLAGFTVALGLAVGLEYADDRIKNPDEIKQYLKIPFLGMVPALFGNDIENPLISNRVTNTFAESIRSIRTNVLFSSADEGGRVIVVTSTGPGEGKTIVSTNLGVALAQAGQRVLLIDADMRKPRVNEVFGMQRAPGLSNVLVGNSPASTAVRQSSTPGLWVLTAGAHPPNPAELLGSKRFRDFLTSVGKHFDWVLIDTPPVMAVTDAPIVAHMAKGVIFVTGAEMTSRRSAQRAIEQLENAHAKFVGGILNKVDLENEGYYYSHYYRKEYSDYYEKAVGT